MFIAPAKKIGGELSFAGDKSLSHRLILLSLLNNGTISISNPGQGTDIQSSLTAVEQLGVKIDRQPGQISLQSQDFLSRQGHYCIDCGNSATTARLLTGILAGQPGFYRLEGDASLSKRPMQRLVQPLLAMNADIKLSEHGRLPIEISGSNQLRGTKIANPSGSAQVKTAIMLAALQAFGITLIEDCSGSRDHSERLFSHLNLPIQCDREGVNIKGPAKLSGNHHFDLPGDISSAAFFVVAACILPNSQLVIKNVLLNPTRTGFIRVLQRMGAEIVSKPGTQGFEPAGDLIISSSKLRATEIQADEIPTLIDELPILAVAMAFAEGRSQVHGAQELRYKEADRISRLIAQLKTAGVACEEFTDGFAIRGGNPVDTSTALSSCDDHRLAMSLAILALGSQKGLNIRHYDCTAVSFPDFNDYLSACVKTK